MLKRLICFYTVCIAILCLQPFFSTKVEARHFKFPAGKWQVDANNYKGVLYFEPGYAHNTSATHYGTIFSERITPITFKHSTGEIRFFRSNPVQEYIGHVRGNQISGTFSSQGKIYSWRAWRGGGSPSTHNYSSPPSQQPHYIFPSGKWDVVANNYKGALHLSSRGDSSYHGTIFGERITKIAFDHRKGKLRFYRPLAHQQYTCFLKGNGLNGTFTQNNRRYKWSASARHDNYPPTSSEQSYDHHSDPPSQQSIPQASFNLPSGSWQVEANKYRGTLQIPYDNNYRLGSDSRQSGTIFNDRIINITFNDTTGELRFSRPSSGQHYNGTVRGSQINGFFTQPATGSHRYYWRAWR